MYTNSEQTAKLIEEGFEKPKSISSIKVTGDIITTADDLIGEPSSVMGGKCIANYSIGELIEMLPRHIEDKGATIDIGFDMFSWVIAYLNIPQEYVYCTSGLELIDALYEMILRLKEEGVI